MRKFIFLGIIISLLAIYNSNIFQSFIFPKKFYAPIIEKKFDVTKNGTTIVLPVKHKYIEPHCLYISVPDPDAFTQLIIRNNTLDFNFSKETGILKYKFISDGVTLDEGITIQPQRKYLLESTTSSSISILEFNLPYKNSSDNLELHLQVIEPMIFLSKYSGEITCNIRPETDYK